MDGQHRETYPLGGLMFRILAGNMEHGLHVYFIVLLHFVLRDNHPCCVVHHGTVFVELYTCVLSHPVSF
jgi:hypothetical protein